MLLNYSFLGSCFLRFHFHRERVLFGTVAHIRQKSENIAHRTRKLKINLMLEHEIPHEVILTHSLGEFGFCAFLDFD